jgi:hypothetical protein
MNKAATKIWFNGWQGERAAPLVFGVKTKSMLPNYFA